MTISRIFCASLVCAGLTLGSSARANPRPLPFTYQHEQLSEGDAELEQFVDFTPVRATSLPSGEPGWYGLTQFQTEFEYGITARLELGLYFTWAPSSSSGFMDVPRPSAGNGLKQRLRFQPVATGEWPIDVSFYGEVSENEREVELEAKVILQRRLGRLRAIANLTGERELYFDGRREIVLAPSAGLTFEPTAAIQPGFEWWMKAEYPERNAPSPRPFGLGPHHYLGPVLLLNFGRLWWSTGAYLRVSDFGHTLVPGEPFGKLWVRSMVGFGL
jgi:hypothetical protein